jgi:hypothetical protein
VFIQVKNQQYSDFSGVDKSVINMNKAAERADRKTMDEDICLLRKDEDIVEVRLFGLKRYGGIITAGYSDFVAKLINITSLTFMLDKFIG